MLVNVDIILNTLKIGNLHLIKWKMFMLISIWINNDTKFKSSYFYFSLINYYTILQLLCAVLYTINKFWKRFLNLSFPEMRIIYLKEKA